MQRDTPARATLTVVSLFGAGILFGSLAGSAAVARATDPYAHLDTFARVLTTIERDYAEPLTTEELVSSAIEGMVADLDRHSRWLEPEQLQDLVDDAEGSSTGIGISVSLAEQGVVVTEVVEGGPADRAGIEPRDLITAVDDQQLAGLTLARVEPLFEGVRGEEAVLRVQREGWDEPRPISMVRDHMERSALESGRSGQVVYVHLEEFGDGVAADLMSAVRHEASKVGGIKALDGLVIDVRDNPGGLLTEAIRMCDLFLDEGVIVSTRIRSGGPAAEEVHEATPGGLPSSLPVVILINGLSASASEIFAAALQEAGRAQLVGETTYGKGSVQQVYMHVAPEHSALKLTVGSYYTRSGAPVASREGRAPDVEVVFPTPPTAGEELAELLGQQDLPDDTRAEIASLLERLKDERRMRPQIRWDHTVAQRLEGDPQVRAAVELLQR